MLTSGITKVAHWQLAVQQQHPPPSQHACSQCCLHYPRLGGRLLPQPQPQPLLPSNKVPHHQALSSSRTARQVSSIHSAFSINSFRHELSLSLLLALSMSFLGILLGLGGVHPGRQLSQLLPCTHKGCSGARATCHYGCGGGASSLLISWLCARPVIACGSYKPKEAKSWLQGLLSVALVCCPCQAQTNRQLKSCKSLSPNGQLPFRPPLLADLAPAQTCQTRSQPGWHLTGAQGFIGRSGSNSYRLSSSSSHGQLGNLVSFHQKSCHR